MTGRPPIGPAAIGSLLLGFGLGMQGIATLRIAGRSGLGTPEDGAVFALCFVGVLLLGALTLGRVLGARNRVGIAIHGLLAAAAAAVNLAVLAGVTSPRGLRALCSRYAMDVSLAGTLRVDVAAGITMCALPALGAGALVAVAHRSERRFVTLGALAAGAFLSWLGFDALFDTVAGARGSAGVILIATSVATAGAAALFTAPWMRFAAVAAALVAPWIPVTPVVVPRPWDRFPAAPTTMFETRDGQFTLERKSDVSRVLLDQRPVSPTLEGIALERACVEATREVIPIATGAETTRVVLLGLATPERIEMLLRARFTVVAETAAWWRSGAALVNELGEEATPETPLLRYADAPEHDLVLALPHGAAAALDFDLAAIHSYAAPAVVWWPMDYPLPHDRAPHVLATDGAEGFSVGFVYGPVAGVPAPEKPHAPDSFEWLRTRPDGRARAAWARYAEARAAELTADGFDRGLADLAAKQRPSSPFEAPLERIELDARSLQLLCGARALNPANDRFRRRVIEGIADALRAQGEAPWAFQFLGPCAEAHGPWPRLERVLAWAEMQELDDAAAVERLEPLAAAMESRLVTLDLASALIGSGRPKDAADRLRRLAESSADRGLLVALADALVAAGNPEGRALATQLLRDEPQNAVLFSLARGKRHPSATPLPARPTATEESSDDGQ